MDKKNVFSWLISQLDLDIKVESTSLISDCILNIDRKEGESLRVYRSSANVFTISLVEQILSGSEVDFILHISKDPIIEEGVLSLLDSKTKVLGYYNDLFKVVRQGYNWPYWSSETRFIMRGLKQHNRVSAVERLDAKRYKVSRSRMDNVIIIAINDYDFGMESVRAAIEKYKKFDAILKSNPNGGVSSDSVHLAESLGIKVFTWGELLSELNKEWN